MKQLIASMIVLLFISVWNAFDIPQPQGYINDLANIIEELDEQTLEQQIVSLKENTTDEIAILTLPSLEWENIDMLGTQIAQERWVGNDGEDNWLLIIIAPNERERRIDVGYGLEWTIPDAIAYRYWSQILPDYFRAWEYWPWLIDLTTRLIAILEGREDIPEDMQNADDEWARFGYIVAMTILIMILSPVFRSFLKNKKPKSITATTWASVMTLIGVLSFGLGLLLPFLIWFFIRRFIWLFGTAGSHSWWGYGWSRGWRSSGWWGSFGWFGWFWGGSFGGWGASGWR